MSDKNLVTEFVQLTSCNIDEAELWLDMAGSDVAQAVDLFFNNDQGGAGQSGSSAGASGSASGSASGGGFGSKGDGFPMDYNPADFEGEPEVRAGDAVVTANLLGDAPINARGIHNPIANMDHIRALQQQYQASLHPGQAKPPAPPVAVFGNAHGTQREQSLAEMYKVNSKLLYRGDFDQAREHAKQQDMWLLVSIHADDEFACHVLNRDVWSDELVEEVVRACFVFWYREDKSAEGRHYIERYKVAGAPYLGIIDPRTRGLVKCFQGPKGVPSSAMGMVERLQDFLGRYSRPSEYNVAGTGTGTGTARTATAASTDSSAGFYGLQTSRSAARFGGEVVALDGADEDEDEQMRKALCLSLEQSPSGSTSPGATATATATADDSGPEVASASLGGFAVANYPLEAVPGSGAAGGAKLQFRLLDGKKAVQVFGGEQPLQAVVAWAAAHVSQHTGNPGARFELMYGFPQQKFSGLCNSAQAESLISSHSGALNNAVMSVRLL